MIEIAHAESEQQIRQVRELLAEFVGWVYDNIENGGGNLAEIPAFREYRREFATLPGRYAPPEGRLLLAIFDGKPAGCVALKKISDEVCELKRFYVRPEFRGQHIGRRLVETLVEQAREIGYATMILDSHISMKAAHHIYRSVGFETVAPPGHFPDELKAIAVFMELDLTTFLRARHEST